MENELIFESLNIIHNEKKPHRHKVCVCFFESPVGVKYNRINLLIKLLMTSTLT